MKITSKILIAILFTFLVLNKTNAQSKWYVNTSIQTTGSTFSDGSNHNSFFLYGGLTYQAQKLYLSLSLPVVITQNNTFTQIGNTFLPNNHMGDNSSNNFFNRFGHMNNQNGNMTTNTNVGLGDLYLNSSFQVIDENKILPSFSIDGYVKFPTASSEIGIGTGKFDFQIAVGAKKYINNFSLFAQFGYLFLGEVEGSEVLDPFTFTFGIGYTFTNRKHSLLFGYDSYSTIIQGAASPKQLALGYNYLINNGFYISAIAAAGLNSSTSDYTFSIGLNFEI